MALQKLARGEGSEVLVAAATPLHFEETLELEHPVELLEPLAFLLARLLEPLCARLAARTLAANELRLELQLDTAIRDEDTTALPNCGIAELQNLRPPDDATQFGNSAVPQFGNFLRVLRFPVPMLDARIFLKLLQGIYVTH